MNTFLTGLLVTILLPVANLGAADPTSDAAATDAVSVFKTRLTTTLQRHLDQLLAEDGAVRTMKGKTAEGNEALAFYLMFEKAGDERYRKAALLLVDQVLQDMRATKHRVLPIKEKEKPGGEKIVGGGPPALVAYATAVAYILHAEGGRNEDLRYVATVLDRYPWNPEGWWASTIDVATGESKLPMSKPAIINKTASIAMAAGIISGYMQTVDPELAARLKAKADRCIYDQILPAQEADGFWHYSLLDKDPKDKDVLGYFMLTTKELMDLQKFNPAYREERLNAALKNAQAFALQHIAPMTAPNTGKSQSHRATRGTKASGSCPLHWSTSPAATPGRTVPTPPKPSR